MEKPKELPRFLIGDRNGKFLSKKCSRKSPHWTDKREDAYEWNSTTLAGFFLAQNDIEVWEYIPI